MNANGTAATVHLWRVSAKWQGELDEERFAAVLDEPGLADPELGMLEDDAAAAEPALTPPAMPVPAERIPALACSHLRRRPMAGGAAASIGMDMRRWSLARQLLVPQLLIVTVAIVVVGSLRGAGLSMRYGGTGRPEHLFGWTGHRGR